MTEIVTKKIRVKIIDEPWVRRREKDDEVMPLLEYFIIAS
jgi:hypothetical protein